MKESKKWPDRYINNNDSIGIELVGHYDVLRNGKGQELEVYHEVTNRQNDSLKWLIDSLSKNLDIDSITRKNWSISIDEIYRHNEIGRKNETEASTTNWK